MGYTTLRPTSITPKAHELAKEEARRRENMGIPSSITAVISEAVIDYATRHAENGEAATREGADVSTTVSRNECKPKTPKEET